MKFPFLTLILSAMLFVSLPCDCVYSQEISESTGVKRHPEFITPPGLRGRVNFWKDIFTKYGRNQVVVHHREYPQVVFKVLDFKDVADTMSPAAMEKFKKKVIEDRLSTIRGSLRFLASGGSPRDQFERQVVELMRFIPGGYSKYSRTVNEDLIRTQTGIKEKFELSVKRSGRYLPIMEAIFVKEYGLPRELTRLPFVESSFDYTAYSSVGAAGIWQFMPRTGRLYMTINNLVDERRDPIESTRAAARYLGAAYTRIGTWPLAATSYNHGVGGIIKKVREAGTTDIVSILESHSKRVLGFASGNFFPELLAAIEVHSNYHQYFPDLILEKPLKIASVRLSQPLSLGTITSRIGISVDELKSVNYGISKVIWAGRSRVPAGYNLKVPSEYGTKLALLKQGEVVIQNSIPKDMVVQEPTEGAYSVRRGDTLASVARRFKITPQQLREDNFLKGDGLQVGQTLAIRSTKPAAKAKSGAFEKSSSVKKKVSTVQSGRTYVVKSGDTLWSISKKLGVKVETIKRANLLKGSKVTVGMKLTIPTK